MNMDKKHHCQPLTHLDAATVNKSKRNEYLFTSHFATFWEVASPFTLAANIDFSLLSVSFCTLFQHKTRRDNKLG